MIVPSQSSPSFLLIFCHPAPSAVIPDNYFNVNSCSLYVTILLIWNVGLSVVICCLISLKAAEMIRSITLVIKLKFEFDLDSKIIKI